MKILIGIILLCLAQSYICMPAAGNPPQSRGCGPQCYMFCFNGFETDSRGCPICQCRGDLERQ